MPADCCIPTQWSAQQNCAWPLVPDDLPALDTGCQRAVIRNFDSQSCLRRNYRKCLMSPRNCGRCRVQDSAFCPELVAGDPLLGAGARDQAHLDQSSGFSALHWREGNGHGQSAARGLSCPPPSHAHHTECRNALCSPDTDPKSPGEPSAQGWNPSHSPGGPGLRRAMADGLLLNKPPQRFFKSLLLWRW